MKFMIFFGVLLVAFSGVQLSETQKLSIDDAFNNFKKEFGKVYADAAEESRRKEIFSKNLEKIEAHNVKYQNGEVPYHKGVTQFTDLVPAELSSFGGFDRSMVQVQLEMTNQDKQETRVNSSLALPASIDWTKNRGLVTPVKHQSRCGSSWAFAALASIETQYTVLNGHSQSLSVQYMIDCSQKNHGCEGGLPGYAYADIIDGTIGLATEKSYPYIGEVSKIARCDKHKVSNVNDISVAGYTQFKKGDEDSIMRFLVQVGPIATGMDVNENFFYYKGGVWNACNDAAPGPDRITHAVTIVGFGTDKNGQDYWKIKNSWGEAWGEKGYARIIRNNQNACGIADSAFCPIVKLNL